MSDRISIIVSDLLFLNASFALAYWIRTYSGIFASQTVLFRAYTNLIIFANIILLVSFALLKLYEKKRSSFDVDEFSSISKATGLCYLILLSLTFLFKAEIYSRIILTFAFALSIVLICAGRLIIRRLYGKLRTKGYDAKHAAILGNDDTIKWIEDKIKQRKELGYHIVGVFKDKDKLSSFLDRKKVDTVFVAQDPSSGDMIQLMLKHRNIDFKIIPSLVHVITEPLSFDELKDVPLITLRSSSARKGYLRLKGFFDRLLSGVAILILSPLLLLAAVLIKLTSEGPVFFVQKRVGYKKKPFDFCKFRTMYVDAEQNKKKLLHKNEVKGLFKMENDPRITPVGIFLRRSCIDELPQLFNIFKGEMSFVGPRPHLPEELPEFNDWRSERFRVKPGLTGLWQISGRHQLDFDKATFLDLYYTRNVSLWLDMKIIFKTIPAIVLSGGKW